MTQSSDKPHTGGCYCGQVRFEVQGQMRDAVFCHCGQCRKMTGFHMAASVARAKDFRLLEDQSLTWFRSSEQAERGFCQTCGTPLFWCEIGGETLAITMGSLDEPDRLKSRAHIFVQDKPNWYDLCDDLPKYPVLD